MTNSRLACACLLTMCGVGAALSQTTVSEAHVFAPPASWAIVKSVDGVGCRCSTTLDEYRGGSTVALDGTVGISWTPPGLSQCSDGRERGQLALRFVDASLATWRQRLNLEHWQISVVMARRSDLKHKTTGKIRWDKEKKTAVIWVMDASEYKIPIREMLDDMEFTIVHELVHLELASLPRSEASRSSEEHAVNTIAAALLRLARQQ